MKTVRLAVKGLKLSRLLEQAEGRVVLLTEGGEECYALVPADEPDDRDGLAAAERRAQKRLADGGPAARRSKRFGLDDQGLELAELLAAAEDTAVFLTADGRVRFVLLALGGAVEEAVTAAPAARRSRIPRDEEDERPRARGRDVRSRRDRPSDPGLSGNEWVLFPLLFLAIPAAGVLVSSVLYYAWKGERPRRANQINMLGFAVFGVQVLMGLCIALVSALLGGPPAPPGQANVGGPNQQVANNFEVDAPAAPGVEPRKPPEKADAASGLLAYWSLDEGRGSNPSNSGSADPGKAAILHNCRWVAGKRGNAVAFNGSSSWCDLNSTNDLNFAKGEDIALSALAKVTSPCGTIAMLRNSKDGGPAVSLSLGDGCIVGYIREDRGEFLGPALITGPKINDDQWHHVLVSRSAAEDQVSLYLDGQKIASKQASGNGAAGAITTNLCALGCERYWAAHNQSPALQYLRGTVDEVCVYKRQLTAQEIATLAAGGKPPGSR